MKQPVRALLSTLLIATYCLPVTAHPPISSIHRIHSTNFGIDETELTRIRSQMQAAVDGDYLPGAMLMVGNDDGVGVLLTVGTEGPDDPTPVNTDTLWRVCSMTKPIVSVAAMTLVEDGRLNLDDPVSRFLPEFSNPQIWDEDTGTTRPASNVMTIQHLLTQESGIVQDIFATGTRLGELYAETVQTSGRTLRQEAADIGTLPLLFEPGTRWHYGLSTDVLGAVIEEASGQTLDVFLKEKIFDPLGMDDTGFFVPPSKLNRMAKEIHGDISLCDPAPPFTSAAGGLKSTIEDYARFANMLLDGGEYYGTRIISEETLELMTRKYIGNSVSRQNFFYGERGDWGLGFHLQPTTDDPDGPFNFGWQGIGGTVFIVDRDNDFYLIYMAQTRDGPRGAPFSLFHAQRLIYQAMRN
ncbi:MAG: serine hydrolase domain-containing protein [Gammaproteobacteria bacterium]|nr:beta-lactamase family protein [Pseudomonadales bacterium]MCP5346583.1 beta-lactamase family protein [Pseudomonadales bacterium]